MFKIFLLTVLLGMNAVAGQNPPTSSKVSGDSSNIPTYIFQFPNFTGTHTGGALSLGVNSVAGGGTGLATLTANGVLIGNGTSSPTFVSPGSSGNVLGSNGTTWASVVNAAAPANSPEVTNLGILTSVASSAMTITITQSDGATNCSAGSPCKVAFRGSTAGTGSFNERSITAALSIVIPSGTTLGTVSTNTEYIYVYLIDNAGTPELALSVGALVDQGSIVSTTAISGGATRSTIYSTTARSNVPIKLVGRLKVTEATAGTWASNATEVSVLPFTYGGFISKSASLKQDIYFNINSVCSSGTCTLTQNDGFSSCSFSSTGVYNCTYTTPFSATPNCLLEGVGESGAPSICRPDTANTTSTILRVNCFTSGTATAVNAAFWGRCTGPL